MFMTKALFSSTGRGVVLATVAAVALTAFEPSLANAGAAINGAYSAPVASTSTDFSSARRRYRGGGGGAAAAAAFAGIVGTGLAIAASQNRRDYYDDGGPYGYYGNSYDGGGYEPYGYYGGYGHGRTSRPYFNGHPIPDH